MRFKYVYNKESGSLVMFTNQVSHDSVTVTNKWFGKEKWTSAGFITLTDSMDEKYSILPHTEARVDGESISLKLKSDKSDERAIERIINNSY